MASPAASDDSEDDMPLASLFSNLSVAKPTAAPPTVDKEGAQSASKEATRPPPPPPKPSHHEVLPRSIPLREYQRALLSDADRLFEQGERAVLAYLPTGGGKTRVGAAAMLNGRCCVRRRPLGASLSSIAARSCSRHATR